MSSRIFWSKREDSSLELPLLGLQSTQKQVTKKGQLLSEEMAIEKLNQTNRKREYEAQASAGTKDQIAAGSGARGRSH
jgi:hypothetical protein